MKLKVSCTIEKDLVDWLQKETESKRFRNLSHAIEFCIHSKKSEELPQAIH